MIDQDLIKRYFVGRDGFVWWIGQIAPEKTWSPNIPGRRVQTTKEISGYGDRYKVRILGYHDFSEETPLDDVDLPWAQVMLPVTAGGGNGGTSQTVSIHQGTYVYGFFLDGEDAQQPVIMGILGYNQYTLVSKNPITGPGGTKFLPFDGKYGIKQDDIVPEHRIRETPEASKTASGELAVPSSKVDAGKPSTSGLIISNAQSESLSDVGSVNQKKDGEKFSALPKTQRCEPNGGMENITTEIISALQKIQEIQAKATSWVAAVNGTVSNIQQQIDNIVDVLSKKVAEFIKFIIDQTRSFVIEKVEFIAKDTYIFIFPNSRQELLTEPQKKVMDGLSCLFDKIISGLLNLVKEAIKNLVGKFLNVTECMVDNFMSSLLGNVLGGLVGGIQGILDSIQGLLGSINDVANVVSDIIGFIKDLLSFGAAFSCQEEHSCPSVTEWSIWKGVENPISMGNNLFSRVKGIGDKVKGVSQQVSSSVQGVGDSVTNAVNYVKGSGKAISDAVSSSFNSGCNVGPVKCGPPQVSISGGGGFGALANAIVGSTGEILGIDLVNPGYGFNSAPNAFISDPCGKGKGAKVKVKMKPVTTKPPLVGIVTAGPGYGKDRNNRSKDQITPQQNNIIVGGGQTTGVGQTTGIGQTITGIGQTNIDTLSNSKVIPTVTLSVSPSASVEPGSDITLYWKVVNGTKITASNFPTNGALSGSYVVNNFIKNKSFILTAENENGQSTVSLFVSVTGSLSGGNLEIDNIIVIDPGSDYLQEPDGSLGSVGNVWATPEQTIIRTPDGIWLPPVPPGELVELPRGSTINPPNSVTGFTTSSINTLNPEFLQIFPKGIDSKVTEDCVITTPKPPEGDLTGTGVPKDPLLLRDFLNNNQLSPPTLSDGTYNVVLTLCGIEIISGGINYDDNLDDIILSPSNGSQLTMETGPFGQIIKVSINNPGGGFKEYPEVIINSQTGFNAKIVPIFCVKRIGEGDSFDMSIEQLNKNIPILTVVDCTKQVYKKPDPPELPTFISRPSYS